MYYDKKQYQIFFEQLPTKIREFAQALIERLRRGEIQKVQIETHILYMENGWEVGNDVYITEIEYHNKFIVSKYKIEEGNLKLLVAKDVPEEFVLYLIGNAKDSISTISCEEKEGVYIFKQETYESAY